jgi:hypothetical protein
MAYAESESMAIKRLKVALKRKDWQMFEYGLTRTLDLINSGTKISEIQEWYKILDSAKTERVPDDLIQKLTNIIESILTPGQSPTHTQPQQTSTTAETTSFTPPPIAPMGRVKPPEVPFVIFIDNDISTEDTRIIQYLRHNLNKLELDPDTKLDAGYLNEAAKLLKSLDKTYQELNGLGELLATYPKPGIIITSNYDSEIIKILHKNDIDFSINNIKKASSDKHWKIFPLGGMTSIFYCPTCGTRTFSYNLSKTIIGVCKKCSSAAYLDLYPIDVNNTQVDPKNWYMAYKALTNSENWLLISPPNITEKVTVSRLLVEATSNAIISNAYIVSNKSEIGSWWRNKLEESITSANVAPVCFNVEILLNNYIQIPEVKTE